MKTRVAEQERALKLKEVKIIFGRDWSFFKECQSVTERERERERGEGRGNMKKQ